MDGKQSDTRESESLPRTAHSPQNAVSTLLTQELRAYRLLEHFKLQLDAPLTDIASEDGVGRKLVPDGATLLDEQSLGASRVPKKRPKPAPAATGKALDEGPSYSGRHGPASGAAAEYAAKRPRREVRPPSTPQTSLLAINPLVLFWFSPCMPMHVVSAVPGHPKCQLGLDAFCPDVVTPGEAGCPPHRQHHLWGCS